MKSLKPAGVETLRPENPPEIAPGQWRIGDWLADAQLDELRSGDSVTKIEPRNMRLLVALAHRPGKVLTMDELLTELGESYDGKRLSLRGTEVRAQPLIERALQLDPELPLALGAQGSQHCARRVGMRGKPDAAQTAREDAYRLGWRRAGGWRRTRRRKACGSCRASRPCWLASSSSIKRTGMPCCPPRRGPEPLCAAAAGPSTEA